MSTSRNSVQSFLRSITFLVMLGILSVFTLIPIVVIIPPGLSLIMIIIVGCINLWVAGIISNMLYVLPEWERLVLLRLGKYAGTKGPGLFLIPPFLYSVASIIDIRIVTQQVEATATLTKDNVPTKVTAALEYEIEDAQKAVMSVKNYLQSVVWLATEALKNTIGSLDLKELLSNRDEIAAELEKQIDNEAANYGINVRAVRITDIDTPQELVEELAVIARARRSSQAKQIEAEAEIEVAKKVAEATKILNEQPGGIRLRELQNLAEMSKEESSMIIIYPYESSVGKDIASSAVSIVDHAEIRKL